jgi:hypothetical protein
MDSGRYPRHAAGMSRTFALSISLVAFATAAAAQNRPHTLGTGPNAYEKVVVDGGFCSLAETTSPAWVPTADNPQCFVGYRCKDKFNEGRDRG